MTRLETANKYNNKLKVNGNSNLCQKNGKDNSVEKPAEVLVLVALSASSAQLHPFKAREETWWILLTVELLLRALKPLVMLELRPKVYLRRRNITRYFIAMEWSVECIRGRR